MVTNSQIDYVFIVELFMFRVYFITGRMFNSYYLNYTKNQLFVDTCFYLHRKTFSSSEFKIL